MSASGVDVETDPASVRRWLWSLPFQSYVDELYSVGEMTKPDHMLIEPYDYQLRGAAHIHHGCLGPFAGMILADPGGLGKTIQAMLAIYLDRDLPGKSLVVVPEGFFVDEWLEEFGKVWEQGHGPTVFHLEDPGTLATDLLASHWDVVICDYDFVEASYKKFKECSIAPLHTVASGNEIPWKTVYLDQSHNVTFTTSAKHIAVENLERRATVFLEAQPMWDMWCDVFGAIHLLRGHPWSSNRKFTQTFGSAGTTANPIPPTGDRIILLQKWLHAIMIGRPREVLRQAERTRARNAS